MLHSKNRYNAAIMNTKKTHAVCRIPLVGCLLKASEYAKISEDWQPINEQQTKFKRHLGISSQLSALSPEEFDSTASTKEEEINEWLKERGFTLKCPTIYKDEFATASVVKLFVEWEEEATKTKLSAQDGKGYEAVSFSLQGKNVVWEDKSWQMAELPTKDENTQVFIAMTDNLDELDDESLLSLARNIQMQYYEIKSEAYEGVIAPMLSLDLQVNQDWICGMKSKGWSIKSCLQQFILKFNEKGALSKSAAAMTFCKRYVAPGKPKLIFNKPFLLWFSRSGVTYPVFLAVCGYDSWQNPGDLE